MSRIGHNDALVSITDGTYTSNWGVTDLYEESAERLRSIVESNEDFEAHLSAKKEITYASVSRFKEDGFIAVSVVAELDDLWEQTDLIEDALYEVKADCALLDCDEFVDAVRESAIEEGIEDHGYALFYLPFDATYADLIETLDALERDAIAEGQEMFVRLCSIVKSLANDCLR